MLGAHMNAPSVDKISTLPRTSNVACASMKMIETKNAAYAANHS